MSSGLYTPAQVAILRTLPDVAQQRELAAAWGRSPKAISCQVYKYRLLSEGIAGKVKRAAYIKRDEARREAAVTRRCPACGNRHETTRYVFRCAACRLNASTIAQADEPVFHGRTRK